MRTWLIVISVVFVLLAASTGVGFRMLVDAKAELSDTSTELVNMKTELMDTQAELTATQEKLEENFGHWQETEYPWSGYTGKYPWSGYSSAGIYPWCEGIEDAIFELELRIEDLEWPFGPTGSISSIEQRVEELEWTVMQLQWTIRDLEETVRSLEYRFWQP